MGKLLIVTGNLEDGGGQNMILELVKNIDYKRYQVFVLCCNKKKETELDKKINNVCKVLYGDLSGKISYRDLKRIWQIITRISPDVLHAHFGGVTFALSWGLIHKKPTVVTVHTSPSKAFSRNNQRLIRYGIRKSLAYIVAVSNENYLFCRDYYRIKDNNRCFCVNNGVDLEKFYRIDHNKFTLVNVARQDANKNQIKIIHTFSRLIKEGYDIYLLLVGDGPEHNNLVNEVEKLNLHERVEFTGMVGNPEYYYSVSDLYLQSSHREAMPMSILEAMAAGLPIISTNVGGIKDVIKGNGYLVDDENDEAYYNAVKSICEAEREQYEIMSQQSRRIVVDYSSRSMAFEYMKIYDFAQQRIARVR